MAFFASISPAISVVDGQPTISMGPESFPIDREILRTMIRSGRRSQEWLYLQIALNLDAQGVDPRTLTNAQLKSVIEAMVLKW